MKKYVLLLLAFAGLQLNAQKLHLKSGEFVPVPNVGQVEDFSTWKSIKYNNNSYCIIQFDRSTSQEDRKNITQQTGIQFFDYMPRWAFLVSIPTQYNVNELANYHVRAVIPYIGSMKVSPKLSNRPFPLWMQKGDKIEVYIQLMNGISKQNAESLLAKENLQFVNWKNDFTAVVQLTENQLNTIGDIAWIKYVLFTSAPVEYENAEGRTDHRVNVLDSRYATGLHFNGDSVGVAEGDDGVVGPHIDFKGRVTMHTNSNGGTHGDHVAGIITGAGNYDPIAVGNAQGSLLHIYSNYGNLSNAPSDYTSDGIRITSNSLGQGCNNGYDSDAQDADILVNSKFSLMSVHSSGNSGQTTCGGVGQGYYTITGGYKAGKNVIAVGNVQKDDNLAPSSSRGPAEDGRIKPDVCAVGTDVNSTQPDNTYDIFTGTSMACPGVAGTLAVLWESYRKTHTGNDPYSGLMKGILLNTADDLGNRGPDFKYGFGRVNARRAFRVINSNQFIIDSVTTGVQKDYPITVPVGTKQVKIMLYWNDIDGTPNSSIPLINDLNLTVQDPSNVIFTPWVLDKTPITAALNAPAVRATDSLNNVEQITIDSLATGNYTIQIKGYDVPFGPQTFIICYEFISDSLVLTYPQGGESFVGGKTETIRWDAYGNNLGTFALGYSTDNGTTWNSISNSIAANRRYYDWTPPNVTTGQVLLRLSRGLTSDVTDTLISIMPVVTNLMVDTACASVFHLTWDAMPTATSYTIYQLGAKYMEVIGTSTTNEYYITSGVNNIDTFYFSVIGNNSTNGAKSRRCVAYTKLPGEVNCLDDAYNMETILPFKTEYSCAVSSVVPVTMKIKNNGFRNISNIPVNYQVNTTGIISEIIPGPLNIGDSMMYTFLANASMPTAGVYTVKTWVSLLSDFNVINDTTFAIATVVDPVVMTAPSVEDFEGPLFPPAGWKVINPDTNVKWQKTFCLSGASMGNTNAAYMDFFNYQGKNAIDDLETAQLDLTGITNDSVLVTFDIASAYGPQELDTLSVWVSEDCAISYTPTAYKKWGANLATVGMMNTIYSPNVINQWRNDRVDLTAYKNKKVFLRFRGHNNKGNNVYIDNINLMVKDAWPLGMNGFDENHVNVYPNPSDGNYTIEMYSTSDKTIQTEIYTLSGQKVKNNIIHLSNGITKTAISIAEMPAGIYLLEINDGKQIQRVKLNKF